MLTADKRDSLTDIARHLRKDVIDMTWRARGGHPGGSLSLADIMTVLYFHTLNVNPADPDNPARDRVILSKGHGAPIWYAALARAEYFPHEELGKLRQTGALLQGHPCLHIPGVDCTTGSLGLGLSAGCGMALAAKRAAMHNLRVYVIIGDGELGEGQIWEAAMAAAHFKLDTITAILDRNRYQNDGATKDILDTEPVFGKWTSFGWHTLSIDGHDLDQIAGAFDTARTVRGKPTMVIANTVKGKGVSYLLDQPALHYTPPTDEQRAMALAELGFEEATA